MLRSLQFALAVVGAVLLVVVLRAIGLAPIVAALARVGPAGFAVLIALELVLDACYARGWQRALPAGACIGFWRLFWVRQAGTAINQLTPTAGVGGELVKGVLLRDRVRASDGAASIVIAKLGLVTSQALLIAVGVILLVRRLDDRPELARGMILAAIVLGAAVVTFLLAQRRGWLSTFAGWATAVAPDGRAERWTARAAGSLDARLRAFHHDRPGAFAAVLAWHVAGQLTSIAQLWFVLHALGIDAGVATCLAVEAACLLVDAATVLVPGRVGVHEAGRVLVFGALGLGAATGLAVALAVRMTQLAVSAKGLAAFAYFSWMSTPLAESMSDR